MLSRIAFACVLVAVAVLPVRGQRGPAPDPLVPEGVTVKLGAHTYAIPDRGIPLVPNVGIVVGSRATLVVDTGLGRRNGEAVLREVAKVSRNEALYIVTTHFHAEHTMGYTAFPPSAQYVNSTTQEAEFAETGMRQVQTFASRSPMTAELLKGAARRPAAITFDRERPTHTKGHTVVFVEDDRVLFAGDVVMNTSFVGANQNSSTRAWLAAFDRIAAMQPSTIVPAHGEIGPGSILATLQTAVQGIQARARELKAQGRTADETAAAAQAEFQAQHPTWARPNGIAALARSAYAEAP